MSKKVILTVDDELHILELLKYNLEINGYNVIQAETAEEALKRLNEEVDLILMDIMLPGIDGISALTQIRQSDKYKNTPIIMLTAKNEEVDRIVGLEVGADDYITKPFSIRELMARIKAVLRRTDRVGEQKEVDPVEKILEVGHIRVNLESRTVRRNGEKIDLTLKEFELLTLLLKNRGKVFTREELLEKIWGYDYAGETRTVDVHVRYLRSKLEENDKDPQYIQTVRGVGYKFAEERHDEKKNN